MPSRTDLRLFCLSALLLTAGLVPTLCRAASPVPRPQTPPKPVPFTFVVFGDNRPASPDLPVPDVFRQIIGEVRRLHPAFVITTGDLIYGSVKDQAVVQKEYDEVLPLVRTLGVPTYFATGNHEIRGVAANEALYRRNVSERLYYSFNYGNSHFVVLDTDVVGQEHRVTGAQFAWLERDLARVQGRVRHIYVFEHQQPYPVSLHIGSSLDVYPTDRDRFQAVLEKYHVEALITGHEHLYDNSVHGGVREIIAGGAGAPLYPSSRGGSFYHYLIVTVEGDRTFISVVKPGSVFGADDVLDLAPSEKNDPDRATESH